MIRTTSKRIQTTLAGPSPSNTSIVLHTLSSQGQCVQVRVFYTARDDSSPTTADSGCGLAAATYDSGATNAVGELEHAQGGLMLSPDIWCTGGDVCLSASYSSGLTVRWDVAVEVTEFV